MKLPAWANRYRESIDKTTSPRGCWLWLGPVSPNGYGMFRIYGQNQYAHRVAYLLEHGFTPELVRHTCHNRRCVRPSHLREGDKLDNFLDSYNDGRIPQGLGFTEADIVRIRQRYAAGESQSQIARSVGSTPQNISAIVRRKTWKQVA